MGSARTPSGSPARGAPVSVEAGGVVRRFDAEVTVGRHPASMVVLDDPRVSRHHATIRREGGGWWWEDHSRNGSWHGGVQVRRLAVDGQVTLCLGDPDGPVVTLEAWTGPRGAPQAGRGLGSFTTSHQLAATIRIGRAPDNDVVLADDLTVSRHHAELRRHPDRLEIVDVGSRHGTYVDGTRVAAATVAEGTVIGIGRHQLVVRSDRVEAYIDDAAFLDVTDLCVAVDRGRKQLLDRISLTVEPGQLLAVVGPSGAGKTTLLRALTGVAPATGGTVAYNGRDLYESLDELRYRIGYVPQDDILHSQLRLRAALSYAAELRFAPDSRPGEREARIDEVLCELGLTDRADLPIAKLSGGQRKRASVGLELLTRPALLFLDEPTTGLDPGRERSVMELLRQLADGGRTVVVITHAVASLELCDRVLVLAPGGQMAFFGPPKELLAFFETTDHAQVFQHLDDETWDWPARFQSHPAYDAYVAGPARRSRPGGGVGRPATRRGAGFRQQLGTLVRRNLAVLASTRAYAALLVAQAPVMAALLLLTLRGGNLAPDQGSPRNVLLLLVVAAIAMGLVNACREIVRELPIYRRERTVGLSLGAYLASKFGCLGVLAAAQTAVVTAIVVGAQDGPPDAVLLGSPLLEIGVILFLAAVAAGALGLAVSAVVSTDAAALVMIPVLIVAQLVLSNALLEVEDRLGLAQAAWATPGYWAFDAAATSANLLDLEPRCRPGAPAPANARNTPPCSPGWGHTAGNLLAALAALAALTAAGITLAALALRRRDPIRIGRGRGP
ncbi:MAG: FHA domain-containing protein [Egibacteraceae bacterium]